MSLRSLPLVLLLLFALAMALGVFRQQPQQIKTSQMVGAQVAPFEIPMLNEAGTFSPELWKDKVVVLNVFASWCVPCLKEHPALMKLAHSGKVEVLGLAWKDKPEQIEKWLRAHGNPYRAVGLDQRGDATVALGLTGVPETLIIRDNTIVYSYKAPMTPEMIDTVILPMIESLQKKHAPFP